ncbi:MAG: winged helix-turn-helix domain-containing protein [Candidatus Nanohaloarchaea archaeon]
MEEDETWQKVSYVQMSKNRKKIMETLFHSEDPLTPSELAEEIDIVVKSASRAVRQLTRKGLTECINPDAPRHRRYKLTEDGRTVAEKLEGKED